MAQTNNKMLSIIISALQKMCGSNDRRAIPPDFLSSDMILNIVIYFSDGYNKLVVVVVVNHYSNHIVTLYSKSHVFFKLATDNIFCKLLNMNFFDSISIIWTQSDSLHFSPTSHVTSNDIRTIDCGFGSTESTSEDVNC